MAMKRPAPLKVTIDRPSAAEGKRLTLNISERDMQALITARDLDGITASERVRAMIALWRDTEEFNNLVDRTAKPTSRSQGEARA